MDMGPCRQSNLYRIGLLNKRKKRVVPVFTASGKLPSGEAFHTPPEPLVKNSPLSFRIDRSEIANRLNGPANHACSGTPATATIPGAGPGPQGPPPCPARGSAGTVRLSRTADGPGVSLASAF